jgi:UDP-N-acetylmuramoyl-L-alanyl-D-glutamate--2,6-diaminopimelate ligase
MMAAESIRSPRLGQLLAGIADPARAGRREVTGLELDSRRIEPGDVFVVLAGERVHGRDYLEQALARGAVAVMHDSDDPRWDVAAGDTCRRAGVAVVAVPSLARSLGSIAARLYGEPSARFESIIAVTGTDGKTSVTHYLADMLDDPQADAAVLGTLGHGRTGETVDPGLTTPDAIRMQQRLSELARRGVRRLALEASSHGLAQYRLDGTRIDVAVLTQLGRDHLDYHASEEDYAAAKARLFHWPGLRAAVLNIDDAFGRRLRDELAGGEVELLTWGQDHAADLYSTDLACEPDGLRCRVHHGAGTAEVHVPLLGAFNRDNLLAALGAMLVRGWSFEDAIARTGRVRAVPGRMELFRAPGRPGVVVDYAHNAGALRAALAALRSHTAGRLWCVFGAGGDRDRGKRPLMGEAAVAGADRVIVTDDNPRSEDPVEIVEEIMAGMPEGRSVDIEHDRGRALDLALKQAAPQDLVLLAGKGHETGQIIDGRVRSWSDRTAARRALGLDRSPGGGRSP